MKTQGDKTPRPRIVVVTGPTASGKSAVALRLAGELGGEIVSADSMQVYRGFDIGTAKPTPDELAEVPHHLIDIVDPAEPYHAGRFREDATAAIEAIHSRGHHALVVGGTALYIKVLLEGLADGPGRDEEVRRELTRAWEEGRREELLTELAQGDPATADRLHPNDRSRIIRALEVLRVSGRPLSLFHEEQDRSQSPFDALILAMDVDRPLLYERINRRVEQMIEAGWVEEVRRLLAAGLDPQSGPLTAIGYRELVEYLMNDGDFPSTIESIKQATRHFAKRQMTWMRKMDARWVSPGNEKELTANVKNFLQSP